MQIDTDHLHYWMQAIRQSPDYIRTLDSFWRGQIKSKEWLIDQLDILTNAENLTIDIVGGWNGVLASMLFQSCKPATIQHIRSIDIDPACEPIATMMNKGEEIQGRFTAVTADMCAIEYRADIVINTSCEHITQEQYVQWLSHIPNTTTIVVQSNNYFDCSEHINCSNSLEEFVDKSKLTVEYKGVYLTEKYARYMIIGKKH